MENSEEISEPTSGGKIRGICKNFLRKNKINKPENYEKLLKLKKTFSLLGKHFS